MANSMLRAPSEMTKMAMATASGSLRLAGRLSIDVLRRMALYPDYIPPEVRAQQEILKLFTGRLFVAGNLIETESSMRKLKTRAMQTAHNMLDRGLVNEQTTVELRPVLPEETLYDPELNKRRETVVDFLGSRLQDYGVRSVIPTGHPIIASGRTETSGLIMPWDTIAPELELLSHQVKEPAQHLAMLAISGIPHSPRVFGRNNSVEGNRLDRIVSNELLVLGHVGTLQPENTLIRAVPLRS